MPQPHVREPRQNSIEEIVAETSLQWEERGYFQPALYVSRIEDGRTKMPITLPAGAEERANAFVRIGNYLRRIGYIPEDIILVAKSWYFVQRTGFRAWLKGPLLRQEALLLVRRDAENRDRSFTVLPFTAGETRALVLPPALLPVDDAVSASAKALLGLLDYLFEATEKGA